MEWEKVHKLGENQFADRHEKTPMADQEYRHAGARTNLKDADRPRANRPQPVHALPQDARRHISKQVRISEHCCGWRGSAINRWIADPSAYTEKKTAEAVAGSSDRPRQRLPA
jgi:hypothetical protein